MTALVHIAAPVVRVGNIRRQRCGWCGALIAEHDLERLSRALEPGEDPDAPWEPASWEPGSLVRVEGNGPRVSMRVDEGEQRPDGSFKIPEDACMALDAEVTQ